MDITIPKVWQRVGLRTLSTAATVEGMVGRAVAAPLTLVLAWPDSTGYGFLSVAARSAPTGSGADPQPFDRGLDAARSKIEARKRPAEVIPAEVLKRRCQVLSADLEQGPIALHFGVDTDAVEFLDAADDAEDEERPLVLQIEVYAIPDAPAPAAHGVIYLTLDPARAMEEFEGCVALDLGNTNSTLVCLGQGGRKGARDVQVVQVDREGKGAVPIPTAIRVVEFQPSPNPERMDRGTWHIGGAALGEGGGGTLILGAKRLLADSDPKSRLRFSVKGRRHTVEKEFAAELFVCRLLRAFHERQFKFPRRIALTHPTTFSSREAEQLKQAFLRGLRRSNAIEVPVRSGEPDEDDLPLMPEKDNAELMDLRPPLPEMILDEASAAAFYFLCRDFADGPNGRNSMHYLYPEGVNLLVLDWGGGTTDIALIRAKVAPPSKAASKGDAQVARIEMEVLGRTGHRSFGGDDITEAAFRILKARLAERIGPNRVTLPEEVADLPRYLADHDHDIDELVPTHFDPEDFGGVDQEAHRDTTECLWYLAEALKIEASRSPDRIKPDIKYIAAVGQKLEKRLGEKVKNPQNWLEIEQAEIDAVIAPEVGRCVEYANKMIEAKLGPGAPGGSGEVHRVYIVGNASKYPLIRSAILADLRIPFVDQKLAEVEDADLKNSVAKGAALALQSKTHASTLDIHFDSDLSDKLPFEITKWDHAAGRYRDLYHEHESYTTLKQMTIHVPPPSAENDSKDHNGLVYLERRWPGDVEPSDFLKFKFDDPIVGPLAVWYDAERFRFFMRDIGGSAQEVAGAEVQPPPYRAPVQSGTL